MLSTNTSRQNQPCDHENEVNQASPKATAITGHNVA